MCEIAITQEREKVFLPCICHSKFEWWVLRTVDQQKQETADFWQVLRIGLVRTYSVSYGPTEADVYDVAVNESLLGALRTFLRLAATPKSGLFLDRVTTYFSLRLTWLFLFVLFLPRNK